MNLKMEETTVLTALTILMGINAIMVVIYTIAISATKAAAKKRDIYYAERFEAIEVIIKDQFSQILTILKEK